MASAASRAVGGFATRCHSFRYFTTSSARCSRGLRRVPKAVIMADGTKILREPPPTSFDSSDSSKFDRNVVDRRSHPEPVAAATSKKPAQSSRDEQQVVPKYERLEKSDSKFTSVMMLVKSKQQREKKNKILLEGRRLIRDALDAGVKIETVYFTREDVLGGIGVDALNGVTLYQVAYKEMSLWSDVSTSPGIMAVCKKPDVGQLTMRTEPSLPVTVVCDNIREPGNLGAVLRCVVAAGCHKVLVSTGCVDVWDPKVLRAGAGAHFRLPVYANIGWPYMRNYLPDKFKLLLADNLSKPGPIQPTTKKRENATVGLESVDADHPGYVEVNDQGLVRDPTFSDKAKLEAFRSVRFPEVSYSDADYASGDGSGNIVLVVGGETHGLSAAAHKLAFDLDGQKVVIPLENGVESLNVAAATAVLLFEIRRQLAEQPAMRKSVTAATE